MSEKKMKKLLILLFFCAIHSVTDASRLYVSNLGQDDNPGNQFQPLLTIQKAVDMTKQGDTIYVLPGVYGEKILVSNKKGTEEYPIYVKAIGNVLINYQGEIHLNDPELKTPHSDLPLASTDHPYYPYYRGGTVRVENCSNIIFDGFRVVNSQWFGISAYKCKNLTIKNCFTDKTQASGIYILDSEDVLVDNNEITRACIYPVRIEGSGHGTQECISLVNCNGFEICYNLVHESGATERWGAAGTGVGGEGIDVKEASMNGTIHHNVCWYLTRLGIYCDAWNANNYHNVYVFNNVVHNCGAGIAVAGEDGGNVRDVYIFNSLIYNNRGSGINLAYWGHNGNKKNIHIYNNTLFKNRGNGIDIASEIHEDIKILNNILFKNGKSGKDNLIIGPARNVRSENNLIDVDPRFVSWEFGDFRLNGNSPAIDNGTGVKFEYPDMNNQKRVNRGRIDIGAYEY